MIKINYYPNKMFFEVEDHVLLFKIVSGTNSLQLWHRQPLSGMRFSQNLLHEFIKIASYIAGMGTEIKISINEYID